MRILTTTLLFFALTSCVGNPNHHSKPPEFYDNGKTEAELIKHYQCEKIEYENWEEDDTKDSSLTVCLINSKLTEFLKKNDVDILKKVAREIKPALKHPEYYESYYIIFVTRTNNGIVEGNAHTFGGTIPDSDL